MLSQNHIARLVETEDFILVVDRILANGRCRSPLAKKILRQPAVAQIAALGLALQRIAELSYRPTPMAERLADCLAQMQCNDGLFRNAREWDGSSSAGGDRRRAATLDHRGAQIGTIAVTAVAVRGLIAWRQLSESNRMLGITIAPDAIERGLDALSCAFERDMEAGRLHGHAAEWAIVLWQLGDVERFRSRVAIEDLLDVLEAAGAEVMGDEIARYAQAVAA